MPLPVYYGSIYFTFCDEILIPRVKSCPVQDESDGGASVEFWE